MPKPHDHVMVGKVHCDAAPYGTARARQKNAGGARACVKPSVGGIGGRSLAVIMATAVSIGAIGAQPATGGNQGPTCWSAWHNGQVGKARPEPAGAPESPEACAVLPQNAASHDGPSISGDPSSAILLGVIAGPCAVASAPCSNRATIPSSAPIRAGKPPLRKRRRRFKRYELRTMARMYHSSGRQPIRAGTKPGG